MSEKSQSVWFSVPVQETPINAQLMQLHLAAQLLAQNNDPLQTDKSDVDESQSVKSEARTDDSKG